MILDGESQFTIDSRTSTLKVTGAPFGLAIRTRSQILWGKTVQWMNINIGLTKGYDAFNLDSSRVERFRLIRFQPSLRLSDRALLSRFKECTGNWYCPISSVLLDPSVFFDLVLR